MLHKYATLKVLGARMGAIPAVAGDSFRKSAKRWTPIYEPRPGMLYVRSRAISSRTNDNYDTFPAAEIAKAYRTFVGKPVFVNHHNADHRRARGVIIDAVLHEDLAPDGSEDTWVEVLMEVDAVNFPKLAEAILKGKIDRTSMGTSVGVSECSYCGNRATSVVEFCKHIPAMKGRRITRTDPETGRRESVLVSEICYDLTFFENSLLVEDPADPTAVAWIDSTAGLKGDEHLSALLATAAKTPFPSEAPALTEEVLRQAKRRIDEMGWEVPRMGVPGPWPEMTHEAAPEWVIEESFDDFMVRNGVDEQTHRVQCVNPGYAVALGGLEWYASDGQIANVWVDPEHRRQGIATALLAYAREIDPRVHHSTNLSDDGEAWARAVAHTASVVRTAAALTPAQIERIQDTRDYCVQTGNTNFMGGPSCGYTTEIISEEDPTFEQVWGAFRRADGSTPEHVWLTLGDGTIVDPTADQFGYEPIRVLRPGAPGYEDYLAGVEGDDLHYASRHVAKVHVPDDPSRYGDTSIRYELGGQAVMDPQDLPPVLYHVTTAGSRIGSVLHADHGKGGGLGGNTGEDRSVSFTVDRKIASDIASGMAALATAARAYKDGKDLIDVLEDMAVDEGWVWDEAERMRGHSDFSGATNSWFFARQRIAGIRNPLFFGVDVDRWASIRPSDIGVVTASREDVIASGAMVTDFDLGAGYGLEEVRVWGDVRVGGFTAFASVQTQRRPAPVQTGVFYHVTSYANWRSIRANGLHANREGLVWLFTNTDQALRYSDSWANPEREPCIVVVRTERAVPIEGGIPGAYVVKGDLTKDEVYEVIRPGEFHHYSSLSTTADYDYRGGHQPYSGGPPLHDLLQGGDAPRNLYEHPHYYVGNYGGPEHEAIRVVQQVRGRPDAMVTIYRALPPTVPQEINPGDWISLSRSYAQMHGADRGWEEWVEPKVPGVYEMGEGWVVHEGDWPVISRQVPAWQVRWDVNDLCEMGWFPNAPRVASVEAVLERTAAPDRSFLDSLVYEVVQGRVLVFLTQQARDNYMSGKRTTEDSPIGRLEVEPDDGWVDKVWVAAPYRRRGLATEMVLRHLAAGYPVLHSSNTTPDGRAWQEFVMKTHNTPSREPRPWQAVAATGGSLQSLAADLGQRTAMSVQVEKTGLDEVDEIVATLVNDFMAANPDIQEYKDPATAHGACVDASDRFTDFCKARGYQAYTTSDYLDIWGYEPRGQARGEVVDEGGNIVTGYYDEHAMTTIYGLPGTGVLTVGVDFTAAQYGYDEFPKVIFGSRTASLGYYFNEHADQRALGQDHDLTRPRTAATLQRFAQEVLDRESGFLKAKVSLIEGDWSETYPPEDDGTVVINISRQPQNRTRWTVLHEVAHALGYERGLDAFDQDHGPGFRAIFYGELLPRYGVDLPHLAASLHTASGLPASPWTYWRCHDPRHPFDAANARSTDGMTEQEGYSCVADNPWNLWAYVIATGWYDSVRDDDVIAFEGQEVGVGADGESLVVPDRVVTKMSWQDFEQALLAHPRPNYPIWGEDWTLLAEESGYDAPGNPVAAEIMRAASLHTAMASTTGIPEIDALIEDFKRQPLDPRQWGPGGWVTEMSDPYNAHGYCQTMSEQFVEFARARGFDASTNDMYMDEIGYTPSGGPYGEVLDENGDIVQGYYPEHTVAVITVDDGSTWGRDIYIDFTAAQYGYSDFPKVTGSAHTASPARGEKLPWKATFRYSNGFKGTRSSREPFIGIELVHSAMQAQEAGRIESFEVTLTHLPTGTSVDLTADNIDQVQTWLLDSPNDRNGLEGLTTTAGSESGTAELVMVASGLSLEDYISVAEEAVERTHPGAGRLHHLPDKSQFPRAYENEDYWAAMQPILDLVLEVITSNGGSVSPWFKVTGDGWHVTQMGAQGATDGSNWIDLVSPASLITILHECAHVIRGTSEGQGHDKGFVEVLARLLGRYVSPAAAEQFTHLVGFHDEMKAEGSAEVEYRVLHDEPFYGEAMPRTITIKAFVAGREVGYLIWHTHPPMEEDEFHFRGEINSIQVEEGYRRRGIATEMYRRAKEIFPDIDHSERFTDDGEAWMQAVGSADWPSAIHLAVMDLEADLEGFISANDHGSGCDDIARAVERDFGVPQVWGYVEHRGRREPHSWNEQGGVILDAARYVFDGEGADLMVGTRAEEPVLASYDAGDTEYLKWGSLHTAAYFHTSPYDLSGQEYLLPPSQTGRQPNFEGMDETELDKVFMSLSEGDAWGWAEDLYDPATETAYVYEVEPEDVQVDGSIAVAPRARIIRRVGDDDEGAR